MPCMIQMKSAATCTRAEIYSMYYHHNSHTTPRRHDCELEPFHHLFTFSAAYRTLLIGPALTTPFSDWMVEGCRTMLCSSIYVA